MKLTIVPQVNAKAVVDHGKLACSVIAPDIGAPNIEPNAIPAVDTALSMESV